MKKYSEIQLGHASSRRESIAVDSKPSVKPGPFNNHGVRAALGRWGRLDYLAAAGIGTTLAGFLLPSSFLDGIANWLIPLGLGLIALAGYLFHDPNHGRP